MNCLDRRQAFENAIVVEKGIWLATHEDFDAAIEYMRTEGIPESVMSRVLTGPEFQRNSKDRRSADRDSVALSDQGLLVDS